MEKVDCVFCRIIERVEEAFIVWEDEKHIAFLSIYPNTDGFTIVATKKHYPSYCFDLEDDILRELIIASKRVGKLIDKKLKDVGRTGLIMEGFGINHVHTKLFPMHGTANKISWEPIIKVKKKYFRMYEGYISSHDCKKMDNGQLNQIAKLIRE